MDDSTFGLDAWIESIEERIADTLNHRCPDCKGWGDDRGTFRYCQTCNGTGRAKAGRVVYIPSGANPGAHDLDCPHCMTDYTH